ncbi:M56 family metallopeptidase [Pseudoclavibacter caeni]|jgi:Zn-dependent protease with chaperone function|nr:M56 family metallopeptidase [Pseudoclavibacter caeni]
MTIWTCCVAPSATTDPPMSTLSWLVLLLAFLIGVASLALAGMPPVTPAQVRRPRRALRLRVALFVAGVAVTLTVPAVASARALAAGPAPSLPLTLLVSVLPWLLLLGLGAAIAWLASANEPLALSFRQQLADLVPMATRRDVHRGFTVVHFDDERPIACAAPGRPREILVSSAMSTLLDERQLTAVIAHEYAHLRGRHAAILRCAELTTRLAPARWRGRAFIGPVRLLIELAADDAAARQIGPAELANALARVGRATGEVALVYRAECIARRRWPVARRRRAPRAFALQTATR